MKIALNEEHLETIANGHRELARLLRSPKTSAEALAKAHANLGAAYAACTASGGGRRAVGRTSPTGSWTRERARRFRRSITLTNVKRSISPRIFRYFMETEGLDFRDQLDPDYIQHVKNSGCLRELNDCLEERGLSLSDYLANAEDELLIEHELEGSFDSADSTLLE